MSKSVYSLVLSDDVVRAVDQAAYTQGTSRSNLINQILAEYVSFITPEKRMKDIFDSLSALMVQWEPFQIQAQGSDSMLCIRSPLRVKYNPTIKYTVELFRSGDNGIGELRIMTRTQSGTLIQTLNNFFYLFCAIETSCLCKLFPELTPQRQINQGKLLRKFSLLREDCKNEEIGCAIARYIGLIDRALKAYVTAMPEAQSSTIEELYLDYLKDSPVIL